MAGAALKKRSRDDAPKAKPIRPSKKQKRQAQAAYHSSSSEASDNEAADGGDNDEFQAVNLLESDDDDIHNAQVDDGGDSVSNTDTDASESEAEQQRQPKRAPAAGPKSKKQTQRQSIARDAPESKLAKDAPASASGTDDDEGSAASDDDDDDEENDEYSDLDGDATGANATKRAKSKRADPDAFATSLSKILGTKLSSTRRADPVLARSAAAHEAGRRAVDTALETKARRRMREQKRLAMEKGRVRDVLVAEPAIEGAVTTGQLLETERRLRKTAQRGVVQLFNAFRSAQVKAAEAERAARREGVLGVDRKKSKVTEMSKKGFLDLIGGGGGGLKKGPMEEA